NAVGAALCARLDPLHTRAFVHTRFDQFQAIGIEVMVVGGVCHRRGQDLFNIPGCPVRNKLQKGQRLLGIASPHLIHDQARFARRHTEELGDRERLFFIHLAASVFFTVFSMFARTLQRLNRLICHFSVLFYLMPERRSTCCPAWPRNRRVTANSPSLCPTMFSVMKIGICLRPSWTSRVCPIKSGKMVERRDQGLISFFSLRAFIFWIFARSFGSAYGPFFSERPMVSPPISLRVCGQCTYRLICYGGSLRPEPVCPRE